MFTLDSNTIIYFLAGDLKVVSFVNKIITSNSIIYVPTIVRLELLSKTDITNDEKNIIFEFLKQVRYINLDQYIADTAADIRRNYRLKTPDSVIAATAIFTGTKLVTRNSKDFKKVKGLGLIEI
jgi:predicted nucleic acid-binding protein